MEGTDEATRTESVPRVVDTGIHTYVVPDLSRKSHAGKTPSPPSFLPTTFVLPLPCIILPPSPFQDRPKTVHTPFLLSRFRPAFSF